MNPAFTLLGETLNNIKIYSAALKAVMPRYRRLFLPLTLVLLFAQSSTRELVVSVLSDAFWQVAVFVAITLTVYHLFADKISRLYTNSRGEISPFKQVATASAMGMLPGCGGAIIVITQFVSGKMSFGAVAAVLTATMGDAAFLLIAAEPMTGFATMALCFVVGVISGVIVNALHGPEFLCDTAIERDANSQDHQGLDDDLLVDSTCKSHCAEQKTHTPKQLPFQLKVQGILWQWLMLPGVIVGLLMAGQLDVANLFSLTESQVQHVGAGFAFTFILLWATTREITNFESLVAEDKKARQSKAFQKVALDTNFVTSWVVAAFLGFELFVLFGNINLGSVFGHVPAFAPMVGVLVGMIPGCGPQIITTTLYLSGAVPLSAQIGNAISNDGDALFPAIALSPKVAIVATLYSSIPAIIAAYTYFWLFE
ncbi:MAG: putative manganese transporter [Thalassotalea sp.]|nr:putative manganese transporter [Thalassotalea sp.]